MEFRHITLFAVLFSFGMAATINTESQHRIKKRYVKEVGDEENCVAVIKEDSKPFELRSNQYSNSIQSMFFRQRIKYVECKNRGASCFESVKNSNTSMDGAEYKCEESYAMVYINIYNKQSRRKEPQPIAIPVGCVCLKQ